MPKSSGARAATRAIFRGTSKCSDEAPVRACTNPRAASSRPGTSALDGRDGRALTTPERDMLWGFLWASNMAITRGPRPTFTHDEYVQMGQAEQRRMRVGPIARFATIAALVEAGLMERGDHPSYRLTAAGHAALGRVA